MALQGSAQAMAIIAVMATACQMFKSNWRSGPRFALSEASYRSLEAIEVSCFMAWVLLCTGNVLVSNSTICPLWERQTTDKYVPERLNKRASSLKLSRGY